jgi:ribonuclease HI
MRLRNAEVLARCDEQGQLVAKNGRVEIRYNPRDGRAYFAALANLKPSGSVPTMEPDSFCGPGETVRKPNASASRPADAHSAPHAPEGNELLVFADGACSGNPGPAGIGVVALFDDRRLELSEYLGEATNNIAELTAILRAVELAREHERPLRLYTDSQYAVGLLTQGWKARANKELVDAVRRELAAHPDARLFHVRGHQGVMLNEHADELAVRAVETRSSTGWVER